MSFGFSASDFIMVGEYIQRTYRALNGSSEAEYRSLCSSLTSLNRSVDIAKTVLLSKSFTGVRPDTIMLDAVKLELNYFQEILADFLKTHEKYTDSLLSSSGRVRDGWRRVKWGIIHENVARDLEVKLMVHINALQSYMVEIILQGVSRIEQRVIGGIEDLERVENAVKKGALEFNS